MHMAAFRVLYFVAACGSSSKFDFYCSFLFNSPHDISQSMRKRKYEFAHDVITELLKGLLHKSPMHNAADVIACFQYERKRQKYKR